MNPSYQVVNSAMKNVANGLLVLGVALLAPNALALSLPKGHCAACARLGAAQPARTAPVPAMALGTVATKVRIAALMANALASGLNGVFYISPARNKVLAELFGLPEQPFLSPTTGAFMHLGGLHAAVATQCLMALFGFCSVVDTLRMMVVLHHIQFAIGLWRTLAASDAIGDWWALLGSGGGPTIGALLLGLASAAALL